jgi:glutathione peroxidase
MARLLFPLLSSLGILLGITVFYLSDTNPQCETPYNSIYEISVKDIDGNLVSLSEFKGKVLLVVNTASKCGLNGRYLGDLNSLYLSYRNRGLEILAFPCNQFLWQEPKSNPEIKDFICEMGGEYPVFEKIDVNGKEASDLFKYLRCHSSLEGGNIGFNFGKFLIDKKGNIHGYYGPLAYIPTMMHDIEKLVSEQYEI